MKHFVRVCQILLAVFLLTISVGQSFGQEEKPDFNLRDFKSGQVKTLADCLIAPSNALLVTETTCYSCIKELKALEWLRAKYRGDLNVIVVFVDRDGYSRVKKYLDFYKFELDFFLIDDGGSVPLRFQVTNIPTMMLFDKAGNEKYRKEGFSEGDESTISAKIDELFFTKGSRAQAPAPETGGTAPTPKTSGCASTPAS